MAEINFNQIYDGVTLALHRAFPNAHIHGGTVKQDLKDGDFNVLPITTNHTEQMGTRSQQKQQKRDSPHNAVQGLHPSFQHVHLVFSHFRQLLFHYICHSIGIYFIN